MITFLKRYGALAVPLKPTFPLYAYGTTRALYLLRRSVPASPTIKCFTHYALKGQLNIAQGNTLSRVVHKPIFIPIHSGTARAPYLLFPTTAKAGCH